MTKQDSERERQTDRDRDRDRQRERERERERQTDRQTENVMVPFRGFPIRMVYLYYMSCLRYTILVRNPRIKSLSGPCTTNVLLLITYFYQHIFFTTKICKTLMPPC